MPPPRRPFPLRIVPTALVRIAAIALVIGLAACASRGRAPIEERSPRAAPPPAAPAPAPEAPRPHRPKAEGRPQTYTVKRGDTLHAIALDHGLDYRELAAWNNIENANRISVGQVLRVSPPGEAAAASATGVQTMPLRSAPPVQPGDVADRRASSARGPRSGRAQHRDLQDAAESGQGTVLRAGAARRPARCGRSRERRARTCPHRRRLRRRPLRWQPSPKPLAKSASVAADDGDKLDWGWPAKGKIVAGFSEATSLKGIDIAGSAGQPVTASAGGKVVYAGSGLRGYGKLIIIKHNDAYLSAYAHNRDILVKEGQQVVKGQKIAEMGNTDADQVKLHFEIRRQGKPVDPLRYLPPA